jgi:hypothetical protein
MEDRQREMAVLIDEFELPDSDRVGGRGRRALRRRCGRANRQERAGERRCGGDPSCAQFSCFHRRPLQHPERSHKTLKHIA